MVGLSPWKVFVKAIERKLTDLVKIQAKLCVKFFRERLKGKLGRGDLLWKEQMSDVDLGNCSFKGAT